MFISQLEAQPTISWVAFGFPDSVVLCGRTSSARSPSKCSISQAENRDCASTGTTSPAWTSPSKERRFEPTKYSVTDQEWYREASQSDDENWFRLTTHPGGERLAVALAGPIDVNQKRAGVLAIMIELTRVSNFLSQLTVGKSAGAFILDRDGAAVAAPDSEADELNALKTNHPLFPVAVGAIQQAGSEYDTDKGQAFHTRLTRDGKAYEAVLTPISFPGWSLVTVVPESEFLGPVQDTIRNCSSGSQSGSSSPGCCRPGSHSV